MLVFILRRLFQAGLVLLTVGFIAFMLFQYVGDPVLNMLGQDATQEQKERLRADLGLDQPFPVQFAAFVGNAVQGDFGLSLRQGRKVSELIAERFPATLEPPSGSGSYLLDSLLSGNSTQLLASLRHLLLPAGTLGLLLSGVFANALRLNLRRALDSDYVEAARSRGLSERRVVLGHALPNALLPVLTITGITVASLIGGALLIEVTYSWPGVAFRLQEAIGQRDYPVVQGIVVVVAALVVAVSVLVDLLVALLDPRIRF